ncbi:hypothetical protein AALO_G00145930 [Alosa alosa]|uniref:Uncharacterized protein n=1 Tax=Alosa alosa TaxID=278164 RepID=A0AAV6GNX0_9TELE|nr:hypothetical protein AALO_G00145930 [Alosa alosa]
MHLQLTASCTNSAVIISKAVSCEDCFPENTECILEYSKCVPLPYKRSFHPAREFTHQWAPSTDQGKVGLSCYYYMLLDYVWKPWLLPSTCCAIQQVPAWSQRLALHVGGGSMLGIRKVVEARRKELLQTVLQLDT